MALLGLFGPTAVRKVLLVFTMGLDLVANPVLGVMGLEEVGQGLLNG